MEKPTDQINTASVAFVLPCLNEAKTIEWCIDRALTAIAILNERHGLSGEVIVADNGSDDGSQDLALAAGGRVVDVADRGYGAALIGGFAVSDATYLVMGDSDCSYDFVEAVDMVERLMQGADFCMGSRFKGEIKPGAMPWKNRYIGNPVLSRVLRILFRTKISDSHCGMRAIRRDAYLRIKPTSTGMEFASEMVLKSVLRGLKIDEVPITLSPDQRDRKPHLNPWRDGLRHLIYMFLLSPKHLFLAGIDAFHLWGGHFYGTANLRRADHGLNRWLTVWRSLGDCGQRIHRHRGTIGHHGCYRNDSQLSARIPNTVQKGVGVVATFPA